MKIRKFFTRKPDDPMGALNDLAFLLIIYFLVIAGFNVNTGFLVGLPSRDVPRIVHTDDLIRLELRPGGSLIYDGAALTADQLDRLLEEALKIHPNLTVSLSIDGNVPYQRFVDVVRSIRVSDVENYSFAMTGDSAP